MRTTLAAGVLALCSIACSDPAERHQARIVTVITVDWEGAYATPESFDKLVQLQRDLGGAPLTHFVSAAYFTRDAPNPEIASFLRDQASAGAELAMHLHTWSSLVRASGVEPKPGPSYMTGTDQLFALESGENGFDVDLDAYDASELRRMLRASRQRLEQQGLAISRSFRAGGYLASANVRHALRADGYTVDSSAVDYREVGPGYLATRLREVWPAVDALAGPKRTDGLVEMPIAAVADYSTAAHIGEIIDAAALRLERDSSTNVFVVLALHQESAAEFADVVTGALKAARTRLGSDAFLFTTVEKAAYIAFP